MTSTKRSCNTILQNIVGSDRINFPIAPALEAYAIYGSFFQHGNNSGKRDIVAFHGACIECNMNVDAIGMSIATLKCLAFQTYMTLYV